MESLSESHPELEQEWHSTKNEFSFNDATVGPVTKIWWQCRNFSDHEWITSVINRKNGSKCPYCSNRKVLSGFNDLATLSPDLVNEWHSKNPLTPSKVLNGSNKKVWWKCGQGHEWETAVAHRTKQKSSCPYCSHRKILSGYNDLATINLQLAIEWHPTKNSKTAREVPPFGKQKAWWICAQQHSWQAEIHARTRAGCPYCAN